MARSNTKVVSCKLSAVKTNNKFADAYGEWIKDVMSKRTDPIQMALIALEKEIEKGDHAACDHEYYPCGKTESSRHEQYGHTLCPLGKERKPQGC